jgi:hypothetical protein
MTIGLESSMSLLLYELRESVHTTMVVRPGI